MGKDKEAWRISKGFDLKGDFARNKDGEAVPWGLKKFWKVFNGEKLAEDPRLRVIKLDRSALPEGFEVEMEVHPEKEVKDTKKAKEVKETKEAKEAKDTKAAKEATDTKEEKEETDMKNESDKKDVKDDKDVKDVKEEKTENNV